MVGLGGGDCRPLGQHLYTSMSVTHPICACTQSTGQQTASALPAGANATSTRGLAAPTPPSTYVTSCSVLPRINISTALGQDQHWALGCPTSSHRSSGSCCKNSQTSLSQGVCPSSSSLAAVGATTPSWPTCMSARSVSRVSVSACGCVYFCSGGLSVRPDVCLPVWRSMSVFVCRSVLLVAVRLYVCLADCLCMLVCVCLSLHV
jgi:hypothetical protein